MKYNKKSIENIDVAGKKVLVRCDFNVPQDENLYADLRLHPNDKGFEYYANGLISEIKKHV